jgi:hypothetical protein
MAAFRRFDLYAVLAGARDQRALASLADLAGGPVDSENWRQAAENENQVRRVSSAKVANPAKAETPALAPLATLATLEQGLVDLPISGTPSAPMPAAEIMNDEHLRTADQSGAAGMNSVDPYAVLAEHQKQTLAGLAGLAGLAPPEPGIGDGAEGPAAGIQDRAGAAAKVAKPAKAFFDPWEALKNAHTPTNAAKAAKSAKVVEPAAAPLEGEGEPGRNGWSTADWQAFHDRRARTVLPRSKAAARAFAWCVAEWLNRELKPSPPGRCVVCGGAECPHNPLLPCGTRTHAWMHDGCWPAWRAGREAEAVAALAAMGLPPPDETTGSDD